MKYHVLLLLIILSVSSSLAYRIEFNIDVINSSVCNASVELPYRGYYASNESIVIKPIVKGVDQHTFYYEVFQNGSLLNSGSFIRQKTLHYDGLLTIRLLLETNCYNIGDTILEFDVYKNTMGVSRSNSNLITGGVVGLETNSSSDVNWFLLSIILLLVLIVPINLYNKSK